MQDLSDDEVCGAGAAGEWEVVKEPTFEAGWCEEHSGRADGVAGGGLEAGEIKFGVFGFEFCGGEVHLGCEGVGDEVDDEFAVGEEVGEGIFGASVAAVCGAESECWRVSSDAGKKAEGGEIGDTVSGEG